MPADLLLSPAPARGGVPPGGRLTELAGRELVGRVPDPADWRRNLVSLTASGRRQLVRLDGLLARAEDQVLVPLTPAQREQLTHLRTILADHHGHAGDGATGWSGRSAAAGPGAGPAPGR